MPQNLVITPYKDSATTQAKIEFTGLGGSASTVTLRVLDDSTISFEGTAGQLLSIANNLTSGIIYSVNDVSGLPYLDVNADGTIRLAPNYGTVYSNTLTAITKTVSGAGNNLTLTAGDGLTSGAGGSLILQSGLKVSTGSDGTVAVKLRSGQTSNLQEWQNSSSTVLNYIDSSGYFTITNQPNSGVALGFRPNSAIATYAGVIAHPASGTNVAGSFGVGCKGTGAANGVRSQLTIANTDMIADAVNFEFAALRAAGTSFYFATGKDGTGTLRPFILSSGFVSNPSVNANQLYLNTDGTVGINSSSPGARLHVDTGAVGTKGLLIKAVASQTANLQEWQNSSGTILGFVDASGDLGLGVATAAKRLDVQDGIRLRQSSANDSASLIEFTNRNSTWGMGFTWNAYYDGAWKRRTADYPGLMQFLNTGDLAYYSAATSTADSTITWTRLFEVLNGGNVGIGTSGTVGCKLVLGPNFATGPMLSIDSNNSTSCQLVLRKAVSKPAIGLWADEVEVYISAGAYVAGGSWVHHNSNANSCVLDLKPGTGTYWLASSNSSATWNVANAVLIWDTGARWVSSVQSTRAENSYFTGGNLGVGSNSPGARLHVDTGAVGTKGLLIKAVASQTANLFECQNSVGSWLAQITAAGRLGVGGVDSYASITINDGAGGLETPLKVTVSDNANDYWQISNATSVSGIFIPSFSCKSDVSAYGGGSGLVYNNAFIVFATPDTSTSHPPAMYFDARNYANTAVLSNKPLFGWGTFNNIRMLFTADGSLGIGAIGGSTSTLTKTPTSKLHVWTEADAKIGLIVQANSATQSANLTEWRNSSGTVLSSITSAGVFTGDGSGLTSLNAGNISSGTLPINRGGTGQTTATAAFDALSPVTTLGDIIYRDASNNVRLAGNTTTTRNFLRQTGTGTVSAAPAWDTVTKSDVGLSNVENTALSTWAGSTNITTLGTIATGTWNGSTVGVAYGGTGATTFTAGQILFGNTTSAISTDSGLFWDNTNKILGIGTSSPSTNSKLHVASGGTGSGIRILAGNSDSSSFSYLGSGHSSLNPNLTFHSSKEFSFNYESTVGGTATTLAAFNSTSNANTNSVLRIVKTATHYNGLCVEVDDTEITGQGVSGIKINDANNNYITLARRSPSAYTGLWVYNPSTSNYFDGTFSHYWGIRQYATLRQNSALTACSGIQNELYIDEKINAVGNYTIITLNDSGNSNTNNCWMYGEAVWLTSNYAYHTDVVAYDAAVSSSSGTVYGFNAAVSSSSGTAYAFYAATGKSVFKDNVLINPQSASVVGQTVKAAASQTANLTEWQNSSGTVLAAIGPGGSFNLPIATVTGNTTLSGSHYTVLVSCSAADITITLPAAASNSGRLYNIKKIDSTTYKVIIDGNASETIDGATTKSIDYQYNSLAIHCDGSNWYIV